LPIMGNGGLHTVLRFPVLLGGTCTGVGRGPSVGRGSSPAVGYVPTVYYFALNLNNIQNIPCTYDTTTNFMNLH
jgi:hypothetical protein